MRTLLPFLLLWTLAGCDDAPQRRDDPYRRERQRNEQLWDGLLTEEAERRDVTLVCYRVEPSASDLWQVQTRVRSRDYPLEHDETWFVTQRGERWVLLPWRRPVHGSAWYPGRLLGRARPLR